MLQGLGVDPVQGLMVDLIVAFLVQPVSLFGRVVFDCAEPPKLFDLPECRSQPAGHARWRWRLVL